MKIQNKRFFKEMEYLPLSSDLEQSRQERREVRTLIVCALLILAVIFAGEVGIRMAEAGVFN